MGPIFVSFSFLDCFSYGLFGSLERKGSKREGRGVVGRRVEWNDYPLPCFDIFIISKREWSN